MTDRKIISDNSLISISLDIIDKIKSNIDKTSIPARGKLITVRENDDTRLIDLSSEQIIFQELSNVAKRDNYDLNFIIMSEESEGFVSVGDGHKTIYVVVDPVDGSKNAITNIPMYSTNLAFTRVQTKSSVKINDFTIAVIGNLYNGDIYYCSQDEAAQKFDSTDKSVFLSEETDPKNARIFIDSYMAENKEFFEYRAIPLRVGFKDVGRFYGSGIELISLFAPKGETPGYAGYVSVNQKMDNILAGKILVESRGGIVTDFEGESLKNYALDSRPDVVMAANKKIHETIIDMLNK